MQYFYIAVEVESFNQRDIHIYNITHIFIDDDFLDSSQIRKYTWQIISGRDLTGFRPRKPCGSQSVFDSYVLLDQRCFGRDHFAGWQSDSSIEACKAMHSLHWGNVRICANLICFTSRIDVDIHRLTEFAVLVTSVRLSISLYELQKIGVSHKISANACRFGDVNWNG